MVQFFRLIFSWTLLLSATSSPISKVLELLGDMQAKVKKEALEAEEAVKEQEVYCERRASDLGYSIQTNKNAKEELEARISKAEGKLETVEDSIQEVLSGLQSNEANLESSKSLRSKEKAQFSTAQQNLMDTMESMKKAVAVLESEAAKGQSSSLIQVQKAPDVLAAFDAMVSSAMIGAADADGLTAFMQNSEEASELAPSAPVYEGKSGSIVEMLEDMQDKANAELKELRSKEASARHAFEMLQQSLQDQMSFAQEEVSKLKSNLAQTQVSKSADEKDLQEATTNVEADNKELEDLTMECRKKKDNYRRQEKDMAEELDAIDAAKAALVEKTGGEEQGVSFLQVVSSNGASDQPVVKLLQDAALRTNSSSLALLSRRIRSVLRSDLTSGADAFDKIKTMLSDMIENMQKELRKAADKKAYCDKELSKAKGKQEGKQDELEDLQTKIDAAASKSATLKAEASDLQKALASLAETEVNMTQLRAKEKAQFEKTVPEVKESIEGVKMALRVLREFYGGTAKASENKGTATGIIGMLEVVESDFAKNLAQMRVAESTAEGDFKKELQDMKLEKARKEKDMKYKIQASQRLEADLQELQSDTENTKTELSAIEEFNNGLTAECTVPPESFKEKQAKRQEEIQGLKTALEALDSQGSLLQSKKTAFRWLRGRQADTLDHD